MRRYGKSRALICFVMCMIMALPVYFSSAVAVKAAEQQTIIVGTNAEYSPFEYLDDDGNITGFDYDLLEAIAKEENVKLVWKDMPFDSLMGSMEAGDVQVIAAGIGPTEDRKKSVDFSDVYYTGTQCIISRKDNPIKDFEEMSGKTVAVLEGAQSDMIASGETTDYGEVKDAKVKRFKNASSAVMELKNGGADTNRIRICSMNLCQVQQRTLFSVLKKETQSLFRSSMTDLQRLKSPVFMMIFTSSIS